MKQAIISHFLIWTKNRPKIDFLILAHYLKGLFLRNHEINIVRPTELKLWPLKDVSFNAIHTIAVLIVCVYYNYRLYLYFLHRICSEYESFRSKALTVPDDSRDMIDLIAYMEAAKDGMVVQLQQDVSESLKRLTYLLDVHSFTAEDMDLNKSTLLWPQGISPVFEENEQVQCNPPS